MRHKVTGFGKKIWEPQAHYIPQDFHKRVLLFHTLYAIADQLMRRLHPQLHTYSPPLATLNLPSKPQFGVLQMGSLNHRWHQIVSYFALLQQEHPHLLFAFHECDSNITDGLEELAHHPNSLDPTASYLKFLAQYIDGLEEIQDLPLPRRYAVLWKFGNSLLLPSEFHSYHFIAKRCWQLYTNLDAILHRHHGYEKEWHVLYSIKYVKHEIVLVHDEEIHSGSPDRTILNLALARTESLPDKLVPFSDALAASTEKEALCLPLRDNLSKADLKLRREWARIMIHPSLHVTSTILWILDNMVQVRDEEVQNLIEKKFFAPDSKLMVRLREELSLVERLRNMVSEGVIYFGEHPKYLSSFLFFIRLGVALESHIEAAGFPMASSLAYYEHLLLKFSKQYKEEKELSLIYSHLLFLYSIFLPRQELSLKEMFKAQFWLSHFSKKNFKPDWLTQEILFLQDKWAEQAALFEKKGEWREEVCHEIIQLILPNNGEKTTWEGEFPYYTSKCYELNLKDTIIYRNPDRERLLVAGIHIHDGSTQSVAPLGAMIWLGKEGYESHAGDLSFHIIDKNSDGKVFVSQRRKIKTSEGIFWYQLVESESQHLLIKALCTAGRFLWQRVDRLSELIVCEAEGRRPCYALKIKNKEQAILCTKMDESGNRLPLQLLNLAVVDPNPFRRLGVSAEQVLYWINEEKKIDYLELLPLKLQFEGVLKEEKWLLRSVNFPEYYLSEEQSLPELGTFQGALILENALKEKRILIQTQICKHVDLNLDSKPVYTIFADTLTSPYYLYTIDPTTGLLTHDEAEANLLLVRLFATMHDYITALQYLEQSRAFYYIDEFYDIFKNLNDNTPEARAFNLKAVLFFLHNSSQLIREEFNKNHSEKWHGLLTHWIIKQYESYLSFASTPYPDIPNYILLTDEEELTLLRTIQQQGKLTYLLQFRKQVLETKKISGKTGAFQYCAASPLFQAEWIRPIETLLHGSYYHWPEDLEQYKDHTPFNPYFTRISEHTLERHFSHLYERAKQGKAVLDIYYIKRSLSSLSEAVLHGYMLLLAIVQKNREAFCDLTFCENKEKNKKIFEKILTKASQLQGKDIYAFGFAYAKYVRFECPSVPDIDLQRISQPRHLTWQLSAQQKKELMAFHRSLETEFLNKFVKITKAPAIPDPQSTPFIFDKFPQAIKKTRALRKLINEYRKGYEQCCKGEGGYERDLFTWIDPKELPLCLKEAFLLLAQKIEEQKGIRTQVEKIANTSPLEFFKVRLRQIGGDLPYIAIDGILTDALEWRDPNLVLQANPSLTPKQIEELLIQTYRFHVLNCHITQLNKGIKILKESPDVQTFGQALIVYGASDPVRAPAMLIFQSRTQMIARKVQGHFSEWLLKAPWDGKRSKMLLFEWAAGDGKSTVGHSIMNMEVRTEGLFPISVSPAALYQIERKKQSLTLKKGCHLNMEILEIDLNTPLNNANLQLIYEKLMQYSERDTLKIVPQVYYALELKYRLALETADEEQVKFLGLLLALWRKKCVGMIDEARLNLSPFTQAKIGIGKQVPLPPCDHQLFFYIYTALTDPTHCLSDKRAVCDVLKIAENKQALVSPEDAEEVRQYLIQYLVTHPFLNIPSKVQKEIAAWWSDRLSPKPEWLLMERKNKTEIARLLFLTADYFHQYYSFNLKTVGQMCHVLSPNPNEEIHLPAQRPCKTNGSYYEDPHTTLGLSYQGTLQRGLTSTQCEKLLQYLLEERDSEKSSSRTPQVDLLFKKWTKASNLSLANLSPTNAQDVAVVYTTLNKNPEAILWYLRKAIVDQIVASTEQIVITPQHFLHGMFKTVDYSATLGPPAIYGFFPPAEIKDKLLLLNTAFRAHVAQELTYAKNENMISLSSFNSPIELFRQLWDYDPTLFNHLGKLIDLGRLHNFSAERIATDFFAFLDELKEEAPPYDGIVLFQDESTREDQSDLMIWMRTKEPLIVPKGELISGLAALGYQWEKLKLLTILTPNNATGSDIPEQKDAIAVVLLGEQQTLDEYIQAVMRMRLLLEGNQKIIWGVLKLLAAQIEREMKLPCTPETILFWLLMNEAKKESEEIRLSAYQRIDFIIEQQARAECDIHPDEPKKQIAVWRKYRSGFVKPGLMDPLLRGQDFSERDPSFVLTNYAKAEYAKYGYAIPWEQATHIQQSIKLVIGGVKDYLDWLSVTMERNLGNSR